MDKDQDGIESLENEYSMPWFIVECVVFSHDTVKIYYIDGSIVTGELSCPTKAEIMRKECIKNLGPEKVDVMASYYTKKT